MKKLTLSAMALALTFAGTTPASAQATNNLSPELCVYSAVKARISVKGNADPVAVKLTTYSHMVEGFYLGILKTNNKIYDLNTFIDKITADKNAQGANFDVTDYFGLCLKSAGTMALMGGALEEALISQ
jgi:hypothetical protein